MFAFFLSSGAFLGWSLGANDASNVFGTAVGAKMIRFKTAAIYCSIFVIIGAVVSGAGASHTLGKLGAVNAVAGAFIVAFSAGLSVYLMTLARFPVSTSQAIVGAIVGWNLFSGSVTDISSLTKILVTWLVCPILSAFIAIILYKITTTIINSNQIHMFKLDRLTRWSLLLAGISGSYALGANNIANVMGVFIPVSPFKPISILGLHFNPTQQLFLIGGVAIAIGVFTYSKRVMDTVGQGIVEMTPVAASVVVWSHTVVLFLFSSQALESFLQDLGLPTIPLVPVSSSQAVIGAVMGIGILKKGFWGVRWRMIGGISSGWVTTPIIACFISFISLFFLQNVFQQQVYQPVHYSLSQEAINTAHDKHAAQDELTGIRHKEFSSAVEFKKALHIALPDLSRDELQIILQQSNTFMQ